MEQAQKGEEFIEAVERIGKNCGGKLDWNLTNAMLTVVDVEMEAAISVAKTKLNEKRNLIGLCIGAGGMFSILPEADFDTFLLVDQNAAVVNFNKLLGKLLRSEIKDPLKYLLTRILQREDCPETMINELREERMYAIIKLLLEEDEQRLGRFHWSKPQRRSIVRERLQETAIGYILADITAEKFGQVLAETLARQGRTIDFLNLTNVHEDNWINGDMAFLRKWPISPNAVVMFSSHKQVGPNHYPKSEIVFSLDEYLKRVNEDRS